MDGTPRRVRSRAGTVAPSEPRGRGGDSPQRGLAAPDSAAAELPAAPALAAGDMVVSPYHGVGRVVERGVRTLFGAEREYLTVEIARGRVRLMVPVDQIGKGATLRRVSSPDELRSALEILATRPVPLAGTWQTRKKDVLDRLAAGDFASLAEVVRDYAHAASTKPLASNDRELYRRACDLVKAELEIGLDLKPGEAAAEIDSRVPRA
jgi:RNA polymerase-interacting CarD/CdnL/TRCF family regulator